jgi:hypothetical protein
MRLYCNAPEWIHHVVLSTGIDLFLCDGMIKYFTNVKIPLSLKSLCCTSSVESSPNVPTEQFFFVVSLGGVRLSPLGTSATVCLLYQPRMIDDDYGAVGGMRIGKGKGSTGRKPARVPLCPPQIPHDLTWDRTRTAEVGSQRLTAWAMARPTEQLEHSYILSLEAPVTNLDLETPYHNRGFSLFSSVPTGRSRM